MQMFLTLDFSLVKTRAFLLFPNFILLPVCFYIDNSYLGTLQDSNHHLEGQSRVDPVICEELAKGIF